MDVVRLFFVGAGVLFALRPTAASRYPVRSTAESLNTTRHDGQQAIQYIAAPLLIALGAASALEITIA